MRSKTMKCTYKVIDSKDKERLFLFTKTYDFTSDTIENFEIKELKNNDEVPLIKLSFYVCTYPFDYLFQTMLLFKLQTYFSEEEPNELVYGRSKYESMCDVFLEEDYIKCSKDTSILDVIKQFLINDLLITEDDMLKFKSDVPVKRDFIVR